MSHGPHVWRARIPWWRHQMETFSALLAICAGNSPVPVNSPHKGQWCGALMLSLICVWINGWVNNRKAGDLRRNRAYYDVVGMPTIGKQTLSRILVLHYVCWWLAIITPHGTCRFSDGQHQEPSLYGLNWTVLYRETPVAHLLILIFVNVNPCMNK